MKSKTYGSCLKDTIIIIDAAVSMTKGSSGKSVANIDSYTAS
jgi:hypothetical protein